MEELKFSCKQKLLRWDFFSIKPIPVVNGCFYFCMQNCYQTHLENDKQKKIRVFKKYPMHEKKSERKSEKKSKV